MTYWMLLLSLVTGLTLHTQDGAPPISSHAVHAAHGAHAAATVQGTITMKPRPARRVANRYAGAASPSVQQDLPVVVYLRGEGLPAATPAARPFVMAQRDTTFAPGYLVIPRGATVAFKNLDPFYHNVFSYSRTKRFDLGRFPAPESKSVVFDKAGAVDVFCEIHRSMRGVILVTDNDYHAKVSDDGTYALHDVPQGHYQLVVWHPDRGEKVIAIDVPASGAITVNATF
jgi:plastocyanin